MSNLQSLYYSQGRFAEALPIAVRVWEVSRRLLGEDHPETLQHAHNLATVYDGLGRRREAEALELATISSMRRVLGDLHPGTCLSILVLGGLYVDDGRYAEAEPLLLSAYEAYARMFSPDNADVQEAAAWLVKLYAAWGKPEKAREWRAKLQAADTVAAQSKK